MTMSLDRRLMTACIVGMAVGLCLAESTSAQVVASGKTLTATTTNAVATFNGADLVGFVNTLTGESYLRKPSAGDLAIVNTIASTGQGLQATDWSITAEAGTGLPLATIIVHDPVRTLTVSVKVDPVSQEIVLRSSASVTTPGVRQASWSIAGLDLEAGRWIVPAMSGMVFDKAHPGLNMFLEYPNTWHAQMAVYEAAAGSFLVYSTDPQAYSKSLHHSTRGDSTIDVAIAVHAVAPFRSASAVPPVEWRLKAFAGDWRGAAAIYRDWLVANRPPVSNAGHPWVSNIRTVVGLSGQDSTVLAQLAATLVPSQTLLYVIDWRLTSYDVNYPDYTPRAGVANFVSAAHALGFRVMLHVDLIGVSPGNPDYGAMQAYQVRGPENLEPWGWQWDLPPSTPTRFAYISPASNAFRALFVARVGAAVAALAPDALHLDISGPMYNDGNGPIDGRRYPQGSAQLHEDLIAAFPNLALGGEGENDVLYRYQSFAQSWFYPMTLDVPGHPIATFLFSPQVQFYGHLGQPIATAPGFGAYLVQLERRATLPRLGVVSPADLDLANRENARLIRVLQSWQTHAFKPAWTTDWSGSLVKYQGLAGATAALTDTATTMSLTAAGTTLFQLAHDSNQVASSTSFIPAWPAFDSGRLYGLDPAKLYFLDVAPRPVTTRITSLPGGVQLSPDTLIGNGFASVSLLPVDTGSFDFERRLIDAHPGIRFQGTDTPIGNGARALPEVSTVGGQTRSVISLDPPFQGQVGGETFVEYRVAVPPNAILQFSVGIVDGAACSDGVTFRVTANEFELWHQHVMPGAWQDIALNLAAFGGKTAALRFISHPGPQNAPWCDWARWSALRLAAPSSNAPIAVPLSLASGSVVSGFDGEGSLSVAPLAATVSDVALPGRFTLFTQSGRTRRERQQPQRRFVRRMGSGARRVAAAGQRLQRRLRRRRIVGRRVQDPDDLCPSSERRADDPGVGVAPARQRGASTRFQRWHRGRWQYPGRSRLPGARQRQAVLAADHQVESVACRRARTGPLAGAERASRTGDRLARRV